MTITYTSVHCSDIRVRIEIVAITLRENNRFADTSIDDFVDFRIVKEKEKVINAERLDNRYFIEIPS